MIDMNLEMRLVDALKSKNRINIEETFKIIYDSYFKLVYFCVANYVKNKEDIEEIVNDVFLKFFNHLDNIKIDGSIKYYLTVSAKNSAINFVKKQSKLVVSDNLENIPTSQDTNYSSELIDKIRENLTYEESELIIDHVVVGKSLRDIAKEMDESPNTVKSRYRRSIIKLRKLLGGAKYE